MIDPAHQKQSVLGSGIGAQAGRDINIVGMQPGDVLTLCDFYWRTNFPTLQAEASAKSLEYVKDFAHRLRLRIDRDMSTIDTSRFAEPDVQAAINDAVQSCARRGPKANPDILSEIIAARVAGSESNFRELALNAAIKVVPLLTREQIALVTLIYALNHISLTGSPTLKELADYGAKLYQFCKSGLGLSPIQHSHLAYAGAASVEHLTVRNQYAVLQAAYPQLGANTPDAMKKLIQQSAPSLFNAIDGYERDHLDSIRLTSAGIAIGNAAADANFINLGFDWLT